ncbi:tetratricopeptide repeat protein [Shigella flexneri]
MFQAAVSDLRAALELEPNDRNTQAALGYALWDSGDIAQSREVLEQARTGAPGRSSTKLTTGLREPASG